MAGRDYILCGDCGVKLLYDGYQDRREDLERRYGDPSAPEWTVKLLCPECIAKLRAQLAKAEAESDALSREVEALLKAVHAFFGDKESL